MRAFKLLSDGSSMQKRAEEEEDTAKTVPSRTTALCHMIEEAAKLLRACARALHTHRESLPIKLLFSFLFIP